MLEEYECACMRAITCYVHCRYAYFDWIDMFPGEYADQYLAGSIMLLKCVKCTAYLLMDY